MNLNEMNVEQLEARKAELAGMSQEAPTDELEARVTEMKAINAELEARAEAAKKAEELREQIASENIKPIKEFKEDKTMENRFAIDSQEYRVAFLKGLQGKELNEEERQALAGGTNAIPTQTMNEIIHKLELNPIIAAVDVTNIPGYVTYPAESVVNEASWLDMGVGSTDSTDAITSITLGAYKLIKTVEITADVDAMSIDAFETWLVNRLVNKMEKAIDAGIIAGTGTTQATGIVTTKSTADGTFKRSGIKWTDLCAILGKLPGEYHNGAKFVFNPEFFFGKVIGMVDTTGRAVVVLDPQGPVKYNVLGYPAILDANLSTENVLFGDLSAYKFNFAKAVEVKKSGEAEFRKGSQVYRAMALADGKLGDTNAIVRYVATT